MGNSVHRSLDSILADVETMLMLHRATLDSSTELRLRRMRSHLWLVLDLLLTVDSAGLEGES